MTNLFRIIGFLSITMFVLSVTSWAQVVMVNGFVRDKETKNSLPFANVVLLAQNKGTTTDRFGHFSLSIDGSGSVRLRISYVGYAVFDTLLTAPSETNLLNVELIPISVALDEVQIVGENYFFNKSDFPSALVLTDKDLRAMPSPGERDLFRSLQRLPGITFNSEMSSSLYIRGGSPDQTLIQLDGITVYNPSHVFGFFSMFNNDAISGVKVLKGGFPAEYGTRNGSVLDILSLEGNRNHISGRGSLGLISSSLLLGGPVYNGSWMISARRSYLDVMNNIVEILSLPDYFFHDLHGRVTQDIDERNKISATVLYNVDDLEYVKEKGNGAIDEAIYSSWSNRLLGIEWGSILSKSMFLRTIVSNSEYRGRFDATQNVLLLSLPGGSKFVEYSNDLSDISLKTELQMSLSGDHSLKTGLYFTRYQVGYSTDASLTRDRINLTSKYSLLGFFVQDQIEVSEDFAITPGVRLTQYSEAESPFVEPRLVLSFGISPTVRAKLGTGIYYQWLNGGQPAYFLTFSGIDFWFPVGGEIPPSRSTQLSGDVTWVVQPNLVLSASAYVSRVTGVAELREGFEDADTFEDIFNLGSAWNSGIEALLEGKVGSLRGIVGYTLSWADRSFQEISGGNRFPARHDKRHVFNVSMAYDLSETWALSMAWTFSTGQAYTGILGYYELQQPIQGTSGSNSLHFLLSDRNAFRLPVYHRLDLGATKTFVYENWKLRLRIDVFNAYSRRNALGATTGFSDDPYYRLLPIVPTLALEAEF